MRLGVHLTCGCVIKRLTVFSVLLPIHFLGDNMLSSFLTTVTLF